MCLLIAERGEEGDRERDRARERDVREDIERLPSISIPTRDQTSNLGMYTEQESN